MAADTPTLDAVFCAALEVPSAEERAAYIARACGDDAELRAEVERLVAAHFRAGSFLEEPALPPEAPAPVEQPGTIIGPYKLLQLIGEGGMGAVFMAEQTQPVRRKVALKLIRPGLDGRQVVARFEAERQALALMDHPNIAKVLDAGATESGRPYFVMELVKGAPISQYCDEQRLTPRQRLELFLPVCEAVQHAHQKGVIHRDLKPSNVLIALYDGRPAPKVIDFGVAKAAGPRLTERTQFTEFGAVVGTLEYMSPEQAQLNQLDIDTRSDVYSLGVLLYELLTGTTPLERKRLKDTTLLEALRLIREEEPPRPSARLSATAELPAIAASRGLEPRRLSGAVRGDLNWVVMKALEKDRERRYETAGAFAADVRRFLSDESVSARPPSVWRRFRRFARRNRGRLAVAAALLVVLTAAAGVAGWVMRDRAARQVDVTRQVRDLLGASRELVQAGQLGPARQKLAEARSRIGGDRALAGGAADEVEALDADLARFERFLALVEQAHEAEVPPPEQLLGASAAGGAEAATGPGTTLGREPARAVPLLLEALASYGVRERDDWVGRLEQSRLGPEQAARVRRTAYEQLLWLADDSLRRRTDHRAGGALSPPEAARQALAYLGRAEAAFPPTTAFYRLRGRCSKEGGDEDAARRDEEMALRTPATVALDHYLAALAAYDARDKAEAVRQCEAALRLEPTDYWSLLWLGKSLFDLGGGKEDYTAAAAAFTGCILKRPDHAFAYASRGFAYAGLGRIEDAVADYRQAMRMRPGFLNAQRILIHFLFHQGKYAEAEGECREAVRRWPDEIRFPPLLGAALFHQGKYADAEEVYRETLRVHPDFFPAHVELGFTLQQQGRPAAAAAEFLEVLRLRPDYAPAQRGLREVLWPLAAFPGPEAGDPKHTLELAEKGADLLPKDGTLRLVLGVAHYRAGDYAAALEDIEEAMSLSNGGDPSDWFALAMVHWRRGDKEEARRWYDKAVGEMVSDFQGDWGRLGAEAAEAAALLGRPPPALLPLRSIPYTIPVSPWTVNVLGLAFLPDGRRVLACGDGKDREGDDLRLFDVETGLELRRFTGHTHWVQALALSPDGRFALSGGQDLTLRLWDVETGEEVRQFYGHATPVRFVAFSPDGKQALSGGQDDPIIHLWDVETGKCRQLAGRQGAVLQALFLPGGREVLSVGADKTIQVWDAGADKEVRRFEEPGSVGFLCLSPDGKNALTVSPEEPVPSLWNVATGKRLRRFEDAGDGKDPPHEAAFTPDGRFAVSAHDRRLRLWDVGAGKEIGWVALRDLRPNHVAISPDGRRVASADWRGAVTIWERSDPAAGRRQDEKAKGPSGP